jgi:membrane associated rhomboid family serine protease
LRAGRLAYHRPPNAIAPGHAVFPLSDDNEPNRGPAYVTLAIIALNVVVFLLFQQGSSDNEFTYAYSTIPAEISTGTDLTTPQPITIDGQQYAIPQAPGPDPIQLTLLTSMFMHGDILHIGGNMLFLWVFGDNVEHRVGRLKYLVFYLLAGVIASLAQVAVNAGSVIPSLGASGAISGVLGAYLVLFPGNRVLVFLLRFLVRVPALAAIGMWALLQLLMGGSQIFSGAEGGGVAYMAHIGGFVFGLIAGVAFRTLFGVPARPQGLRRAY